jgi:hypothetical protein
MPVAALVHQIVVSLIGNELGDVDFASLLQLEAWGANLKLEPDHRKIADGLDEIAQARATDERHKAAPATDKHAQG